MFAPDRSWDPSSMARRLEGNQKPRRLRRKVPDAAAASSQASASQRDAQASEPSGSGGEGPVRSALATSYTPIRSRKSRTRNSSPTDRFRTPSARRSAEQNGNTDIFSTIRARRTRPVDDSRTEKGSRLGSSPERARDRSPPHRVMGSIEEARDRDPGCSFCASNLAYQLCYSCLDCPFLLCALCIVNVYETQPRHDSTHRCRKTRAIPGLSEAFWKSEPEHSRKRASQAPQAPRTSTAGPFTCSFCDQRFPGGGYECEQCTSVYLCETDRDYHIPSHTLRSRNAISRQGTEDDGINKEDQQRPNRHTPSRDGHGHGHGNGQGHGDEDRDRDEDEGGELEEALRIYLDGEEEEACRIIKWRERGSNTHEVRRRGRKRRDTRDHSAAASDLGQEVGDDDGATTGEKDKNNPEDSGSEFEDSIPGRLQERRPRRSTRSTSSASSFTLTVPMDLAPALRVILEQFNTASARKVLEQIPAVPAVVSQEKVPREAGARKHATHRPWLPDDRRRLRRMMETGASYAEAAELLGRTEGAVIQQWRKQHG